MKMTGLLLIREEARSLDPGESYEFICFLYSINMKNYQ